MKGDINMQKILCTVAEAASMLNCSTSKIYKLINRRNLPYAKNGKVILLHIDDINAYARSAANNYKSPCIN